MIRLDRYAWRVTVVAMVLTVCPLGPTPSALAAFLDPATAAATFTAGTLQPPTGLSVGVCLLGGAQVTWTASGGTITPTGYEIVWGITNGGPYTRSMTAAASPTTVTNVYRALFGQTNYFRVRAYFGANWKSTYSNQASTSCLL